MGYGLGLRGKALHRITRFGVAFRQLAGGRAGGRAHRRHVQVAGACASVLASGAGGLALPDFTLSLSAVCAAFARKETSHV
jgi:hypothetical protein